MNNHSWVSTLLCILLTILMITILAEPIGYNKIKASTENELEPTSCPNYQQIGTRGSRGITTFFFDNFDTGTWDTSKWTRSSTSYAGIGTHTSKSGSYSMYTTGGTVSVTSKTFNTNAYSKIQVGFWVRRGHDSFSEDPDGSEDLYVEYYNSVGTWINIDTFLGGGTAGQIYDNSYNLSSDATHSAFQIRFRRSGGSGSTMDFFHIDDVYIGSTGYVFELEPKINQTYGNFNSKVDYIHTINNLGAKNDSYDLTVASNWNSIFRDYADTKEISSISVNSGKSKSFITRVIIPPQSAKLDNLDIAIITARSQSNSSIKNEVSVTTIICHPVPWLDDFEGDDSNKNWYENSSGGYTGVSKQTASSGKNSMYTNGGPISVTTIPFDTRTVSILEVAFWLRKGGYFSEVPDTSENIIVEYLNKYDSWVMLELFTGGGAGGDIYERSYKLGDEALHDHFMLSFRQTDGSGSNIDYWHIDDVYIGPLRVELSVSCVDKAPETVTQDDKDVTMAVITTTAKNSNISINFITFTLTGSGSDNDVSRIRLILDSDNSGNLTTGDVILRAGNFISSKATFSGPWQIPEESTWNLFILYNISSTAKVGETLGVKIAAGDLMVSAPAVAKFINTIQSSNSTILEKPDSLLVVANNKAPEEVELGETDVLIMSISLKALTGSLMITGIHLDLTGTGEPDNVAAVKLYHDVDNNGQLNLATDSLLATNSSVWYNFALTGVSMEVKKSIAEQLLVTFDISEEAVIGKSIGCKIQAGYIIVDNPDYVLPFETCICGPFTIIPERDRLPPAPPIELTIVAITHNAISLEWTPNIEDDVVGYNIYRSINSIPRDYNWSDPIGNTIKGTEKFTDIGLIEDTEYYYVVTAYDEVPNESNYSNVVNGTTKLTPIAPQIKKPVADFKIVEDTYDITSINLFKWFSDKNNDILIFTCTGQKYINVTIFQNNGTVLLEPKQNWNGQERLTFFVYDGLYEIFDDVVITVTPVNDPPENLKILSPEDGTSTKVGTTLNFYGTCDDPDIPYGDILTYKWSSNIDGIFGDGESVLDVDLSAGEHSITLEVADSYDNITTQNISVSITTTKTSKEKDGTGGTDEDAPLNKIQKDNAFIAMSIIIIILICLMIFIIFILFFKKHSKEQGTYETGSGQVIQPQPPVQMVPPRSPQNIQTIAPFQTPQPAIQLTYRPTQYQLPPRYQGSPEKTQTTAQQSFVTQVPAHLKKQQ